MNMHRVVCLLIIAFLARSQGSENLNSVLWMQTSAEYQAVTRQTYAAGKAALEKALADPRWTAALEQVPDITGNYDKYPPAVILDLDETVLDNSPIQARNVVKQQGFTDAAWQAWVKEQKAGVIAGAHEFLAYAHGRGSTLR